MSMNLIRVSSFLDNLYNLLMMSKLHILLLCYNFYKCCSRDSSFLSNYSK